jgi:hypothetical protein
MSRLFVCVQADRIANLAAVPSARDSSVAPFRHNRFAPFRTYDRFQWTLRLQWMRIRWTRTRKNKGTTVGNCPNVLASGSSCDVACSVGELKVPAAPSGLNIFIDELRCCPQQVGGLSTYSCTNGALVIPIQTLACAVSRCEFALCCCTPAAPCWCD